jgi:hypothetical protein
MNDMLKILYNITDIKVTREGNRAIDDIKFEVTTPREFYWNDVVDLQTKLGYNPMGYGVPRNLNYSRTINSDIIYTWNCNASCD